MPSEPVEPLDDSTHLLDMAADVLNHDDALRIVRRLKRRFPCMSHERCFCPADDAPPPRDLLPPCVVCGKPGAIGVGHIDRNDELWYCNDHLDAGYERAAQEDKRRPRL